MTAAERYQQGEHQLVCEELERLDDDAYISPVREDAVVVAREFVDRCARNLKKIKSRLVDLDYAFDREERSLQILDERDYSAVEEFESEFGAMPIILREWHARIVSLDFGQADNQYLDFDSPLGGLGWHYELQMLSLADARLAWEDHVQESERTREHFRKQGLELSDSGGSPFLFTGGCASNNDCDGITLPCMAFDAVRRDDGTPRTVNRFFRTAFRYAGFPTLEIYDTRLRDTLGNILPRPDIEQILPTLTDNLEPV